ncbi:uncharacterized protein MAL13P1.304-like isoform X2 [Symsagittifera roscoffensis]|uniref:uncharacterized protein MAL13P1.304-like isoform X2 n=1 Tax=Symsagittifera roscoffensis TaxID=84072 RepID=UPI00307BBC61
MFALNSPGGSSDSCGEYTLPEDFRLSREATKLRINTKGNLNKTKTNHNNNNNNSSSNNKNSYNDSNFNTNSTDADVDERPKVPPLRLYQKQVKQNATGEYKRKKKKSENRKGSQKTSESNNSLQSLGASNYSDYNDENTQRQKKVSLPLLQNNMDRFNSSNFLEVDHQTRRQQSFGNSRGCSSLPPLSDERGSLIRALSNHKGDDFSQSVNISNHSYSCNKLPLIRKKSYSLPDLQQHVKTQQNSRVSSQGSDYFGTSTPSEETGASSARITLPRLG